MKDESIIWTGVSFKDHIDMNVHWAIQGFIKGKPGERRFLLFCNKEINVILQDIKSGKSFDIPSGAQAKGKRMAREILKEENENL